MPSGVLPTEYELVTVPFVYFMVIRVHKYGAAALVDGTDVLQVPVGAVVPDEDT